MADPIKLSARLRSVRCALRGLRVMVQTQHNAWIHLAITVAVIVTAVVVGLSGLEWVALVLAIVGVWSAEALNTAIEFLADAVSPDHHPLIGRAKDVAAGGVLVVAVGASVVGLVVLGPHLLVAVGLVD
jgi:diacylglycerol kinase